MQTLEHTEDAVQVLLIEADAVVFDRNLTDIQPALRVVAQVTADLNDGRLCGLAELYAVANQVLQQLRHLTAVRDNDRQRADFYPRTSLSQTRLQLRNYPP